MQVFGKIDPPLQNNNDNPMCCVTTELDQILVTSDRYISRLAMVA